MTLDDKLDALAQLAEAAAPETEGHWRYRRCDFGNGPDPRFSYVEWGHSSAGLSTGALSPTMARYLAALAPFGVLPELLAVVRAAEEYLAWVDGRVATAMPFGYVDEQKPLRVALANLEAQAVTTPTTEAGKRLERRIVGLNRDYFRLNEDIAAIEAEAIAAFGAALLTAVEGLPNASGGHMDTVWDDVTGATQSWRECGHGLSRAAVLDLIRTTEASDDHPA